VSSVAAPAGGVLFTGRILLLLLLVIVAAATELGAGAVRRATAKSALPGDHDEGCRPAPERAPHQCRCRVRRPTDGASPGTRGWERRQDACAGRRVHNHLEMAAMRTKHVVLHVPTAACR
jgi:hypothetical protein